VFLNKWQPPLKVIIAPHEINGLQIEQWRSRLTMRSMRFTADDFRASQHSIESMEREVLFLDTIGLLSSSYRYADFAFIGGAFGDGLHNILEPAVFGMPIFFGKPYFTKFQEAEDLIINGGAKAIGDMDELYNAFREVYDDFSLRQKEAMITRNYVQENIGATARVIVKIEKIIGSI